MDRICETEGCERKTVIPEPYPAQCVKHYLLAVEKAKKDAAARFQAHIEAVLEARS